MEYLKALIFDIDETLIPRHQNYLEENLLNTLKKLQEQYTIIVATGRAYYFVVDAIKKQLQPDYIVTINGGTTYNNQGELVDSIPLHPDDAQTLITKSRELGIGLGIKCVDAVHVFTQYQTFLDRYLYGYSDTSILVDDTEKETLDENLIPIGSFIYATLEQIDELFKYMSHSIYVPASKGCYDIFSKNSGKEVGLEHVLKQLNITWDEVIAFGDSPNDNLMLSKAKHSVAMGNGYESTKKAAEYVTSSAKDNGIIEALRHFKVIE